MKFAIVILSVVATALAQRPWYAGSGPIGYPGLAPRFKTDGDSEPPVAANPNDYYNVPPTGIPIDAHGDVALVNRLNTWSRQNRPFWLLNAEQIEAHRNTHRFPVPDYGYYDVYYPYVYNFQPEYVDGGNDNGVGGIVNYQPEHADGTNDGVDGIVLLDFNDNGY
ncbi:hypothetical protein ILUMI_01152 [Ignelater luminosus]|uniref:Uncharacterized protein n=1 Tax=Ignelater luminosus TaxID=2038154 RepID=A0A8K0GLZ5_IGNLU|nr:hypothetical protein ILUMI_01152 [Ignelater luminosus]